jgi:hypothetical protein
MANSRVQRIGESIAGAVQMAGILVLSPVLRTWYNRWGATGEEIGRYLPGDELVPQPALGYTRAITIEAQAADIWPWLVQIGQARGGLYSYEALENLVGCDIHNVDRIVPELQDLQAGDLIRMGPQGYPCFRVWALEPGRALVLLAADPKTEQAVDLAPKAKGYSAATWQFYLDERDNGTTRLIVRQRLAHSHDMALMWRLVEPIDFVMGRKMVRTVKGLVQR